MPNFYMDVNGPSQSPSIGDGTSPATPAAVFGAINWPTDISGTDYPIIKLRATPEVIIPGAEYSADRNMITVPNGNNITEIYNDYAQATYENGTLSVGTTSSFYLNCATTDFRSPQVSPTTSTAVGIMGKILLNNPVSIAGKEIVAMQMRTTSKNSSWQIDFCSDVAGDEVLFSMNWQDAAPGSAYDGSDTYNDSIKYTMRKRLDTTGMAPIASIIFRRIGTGSGTNGGITLGNVIAGMEDNCILPGYAVTDPTDPTGLCCHVTSVNGLGQIFLGNTQATPSSTPNHHIIHVQPWQAGTRAVKYYKVPQGILGSAWRQISGTVTTLPAELLGGYNEDFTEVVGKTFLVTPLGGACCPQSAGRALSKVRDCVFMSVNQSAPSSTNTNPPMLDVERCAVLNSLAATTLPAYYGITSGLYHRPISLDWISDCSSFHLAHLAQLGDSGDIFSRDVSIGVVCNAYNSSISSAYACSAHSDIGDFALGAPARFGKFISPGRYAMSFGAGSDVDFRDTVFENSPILINKLLMRSTSSARTGRAYGVSVNDFEHVSSHSGNGRAMCRVDDGWVASFGRVVEIPGGYEVWITNAISVAQGLAIPLGYVQFIGGEERTISFTLTKKHANLGKAAMGIRAGMLGFPTHELYEAGSAVDVPVSHVLTRETAVNDSGELVCYVHGLGGMSSSQPTKVLEITGIVVI